MTSPRACTIIANNYLAYARAFTLSFLEHHPAGRVSVLIVDTPQPGHRYEDEPFEVVFADQLGIPGFPHLSFRYSIVELSTAVKPWFLRYLHRTLRCDRLCYFDPDVLVFGDLGELYGRLGRADALLTPHLMAPLDDGRVPAERDILLSGIYNLGFLGLAFNERTLAFLDWWHARLYRWCLHEVDKGLFVDQRWMDFAPAFLPQAEIVRDEGCNVAYWNLAHRTLAQRGGAWWVGDTPLRFFHFSGYDFRRPELISKFQNRFTLEERPDAAPLFALYAGRLRDQGQEEVQDYPYGYGRFANGVAVPGTARRALRQVDPEGERWPDPFATGGTDSFFDWLRRPADAGELIPLSRLGLLLWDQSKDLQFHFARPWAEDRLRFARWLVAGSGADLDPAFTEGLECHLAERYPLTASAAAEQALLSLAAQAGRRVLPAAKLDEEEIAWLTAEAGYDSKCRPRVPRLAMEMHRLRGDLQRSFPDPLGASRELLTLWYTTYGRREYELPQPLIAPVLRTLPLRKQVWARLWWERQQWRARKAHKAREDETPGASAAAAPALLGAPGPEGFNVIGWARALTGVGEACRGTLAALERAGLGCALWPLDTRLETAPETVAAEAETSRGLPYEVSLYHVNADMMATVDARLPRAFTAGRHRIGYWFWELSHFPLTFAHAFHHADEVWAPSRFCQQAFEPIATVEVRRVPPCVVPGTAAPADRRSLGAAPGSFLFFFAFDALSVPERKNPAGLLAAFSQVSRQSRRPVHLLLKLNHAEAEPELAEDLRHRCAGLPVTLLTRALSRDQLDGLTAACDAYVSLHRSEGLGLPLIEAMYRSKPVIATGYGGVTDFLDEETGFVVRHSLRVLERPQGPYPAGAVWAEPDVEHAAALMAALAEAPESAASRVAAARSRVEDLYSPEAASRRFRGELARIRELREERRG
ncbi:MAG TPA: glycosyltransferase [Thermoanaerobaculia bacterium]|nr:glycosyltransferase [Thermoanaerobaculia bacterium]